MPKHKAEAYALQPVLVPQQHQYTVYASAVGSLSRFLCCHFLRHGEINYNLDKNQ